MSPGENKIHIELKKVLLKIVYIKFTFRVKFVLQFIYEQSNSNALSFKCLSNGC